VDAIELVTKGTILATPLASLREAFSELERAGAGFEHTGERALVAGFHADRLGYAFVGGYEAALARLVAPQPHRRACLCATESGGVHPRAIQTKLETTGGELTLSGEKTFATLATEAEVLYVVASEGVRDGRNALRLVRVRADAAGLTIAPRPEAPFAPEIPHAKITLDRVRVELEDVLPGDGYSAYLKPFRTIEDVHVFLAVIGYLVRVARISRWAALEGLAAHARALLPLAVGDPGAPAAHLALARVIDTVRDELLAFPWGSVDEQTRARWERDQPLLWVAESARKKRTEAALAATNQNK